MDPYLEHSLLWPGFHVSLMVELRKQIAPKLRPRYVVSVEERVVLEMPEPDPQQRVPDLWVQHGPTSGPAPDQQADGGVAHLTETEVETPVVVEVETIEFKERYLEILDMYRDQRVVTVIEVLSPANKRPGATRNAYLEKQQATLASECHLVEIDLLRRGRHTLAVPESYVGPSESLDYLISVNRWPSRHRFETNPRRLRQLLPKFRIPLTDPDPDVPLDLQAAFEQVYEDGGYALRVKYDEPCVPPLDPEDQTWANDCWAKYRQAHPDLFPPRGDEQVGAD